MIYEIDAKNKKLGRLASDIAVILQGKKSVMYNPRLASGDKVVVKNLDKLDLGVVKMEKKIYYRHTGYMGHLKEKTLKQEWQKSPEKVLRMAVKRMLPKNFLKDKRMSKLKVENQ